MVWGVVWGVEIAMSNASPKQPVVAVQSLSKTFKDFWLRTRAKAVDGVTFNVEPGETFGLLGPNGSGKSTTIKIILGLLKPTSGRVVVFGKPPTDVGVKRKIGYLPEESYLYAFLNARETLDYYGKLFQLDATTRRRRIDELLDMVGLSAVQFRPVREYSKGMQRRIGIAQALINDPELLILDEPTTGLDPLGCRQIKDLIVELGRRRKTIILSSHVLADVEDVAHRMVILYGGRIREEGTCEALLARQDKMVIESDELDDQTVAEIDRVIRERSGGAKSILSVGRPRQKLEEKFIAIVERAVTEKIATSGAQHGGATAGFLRAEPAQGRELIESLVAGETEVREGAGEGGAPGVAAGVDGGPASGGPDKDLLASLSGEGPTPEGTGTGSSPGDAPAKGTGPGAGSAEGRGAGSAPGPEVDRGLIGSLLDEASPGTDAGNGPDMRPDKGPGGSTS
jgi:ABC-2 type transport system ATP-binding protein